MTARLTRRYRRHVERRRLADWAWQRQSLILAQLTADARLSMSAVHIADVLGAVVPDVTELLAGLMDQGLVDLTFGGPRHPDGYRPQSTRYYLTAAGLDERWRRCGR